MVAILNLDNKDFLVSVLNKALSEAFEDRKQQLLINLINVLIGLDISNDRQSINNYGVKGFHVVWETVIKFLFGNKEVSNFGPVATYNGDHIKGNNKKKPLRLDALLLRNGAFYILDAKYYHFGEDMQWNSAPDTTDVEKQVVYGEYIDFINKNKNDVYNSFIIPYNKYSNKNTREFNQDIQFVGYSTVSWKKYKLNVKPYYYVAVILVDCKFALESWMGNKTESILDDIVSKIKEVEPLLKKYGWTPITFVSKDGNC